MTIIQDTSIMSILLILSGIVAITWYISNYIRKQDKKKPHIIIVGNDIDEAIEEIDRLARKNIRFEVQISGDDLQERRHTTNNNKKPPKYATYILWYLPRELREATIGDLEEEFQEIHKEFGYKKAVIWYWWQTIASIGPVAGRNIQKFIKWATVGWIANIIRRFTS